MMALLNTIVAWPVVVPTILMGVVLVFWILALVGLVDFESVFPSFDIDHDLDLDGHVEGLTGIASYVVAFGLNGVPFSIVISLLVVITWFLITAFALYLLPWVPTAPLRFAVGTGALAAAAAASIPLTAMLVRPMRRMFVTHTARSSASLVGHTCRIVTLTVDEQFGRAEIPDRGAGYNVKVWAESPNSLTKGSIARIVEFDPAGTRYRVVADEPAA